MVSNDPPRQHSRSARDSTGSELAPPRDGPSAVDPGGWYLADPDPVLVADPTGALLQANPSGWRLIDSGSAGSLRRGRLTFADADAQLAFSQALNEATLTGGSRVVLRGNDGQWRPVELVAFPAGPSDLLFISFPREPRPDLDVQGLVRAFGLTAAEGEVLRLLAGGLQPKEIAKHLRVSTNTIRAHLRTLYLKMHVRGIAGVVRQAMRLVR